MTADIIMHAASQEPKVFNSVALLVTMHNYMRKKFCYYGTNQLQLKQDMHVFSCELVHLHVPHIVTRIFFRNNIVITNLQA